MKTRYLSPSEIEKLRSYCNSVTWLPFEVILSTGLRIGDVLKIKGSDIDDNNILSFVAEKTEKHGSVVLPVALADRLRKRASNNAFGWCFPSPQRGKCTHLTRQAAWARVRAAASRSGVNLCGCSPHSFRKAFAVELFKREGSEAVRASLQHSDIHTTEIYALADFLSGDNADIPLKRGDIPFIIERVLEFVDGKKNLRN